MSINIDKILEKKGQFVHFKTQREMKTKKGVSPITKVSNFVARVGVSYDNMKNVKHKRESGELPQKNQGLPWGEWVDYPYLIEHKDSLYVRCSTTNNKEQKGTVKYFQNGSEVSYDEVKQSCLASEFKEKSDDVFNIKVDSILEIY